MVRVNYLGLGGVEASVQEFELLIPYVRELIGMQRECTPMSADYAALGIALDAVETAACGKATARVWI